MAARKPASKKKPEKEIIKEEEIAPIEESSSEIHPQHIESLKKEVEAMVEEAKVLQEEVNQLVDGSSEEKLQESPEEILQGGGDISVENLVEEKQSPVPTFRVEEISEPVDVPTPTSGASSSLSESAPTFTLDDGKKSSNKGKFIVNLMIVASGMLLIAALVLFLKGMQNQQSEQIAQSTPTVTVVPPTPTSTPIPTLSPKDYSLYSIKVLNGSGTTGEASKVKAQLTDEEFFVSDVGNADNSEYEETVIQVAKKVPQGFVDALQKELEKTYTVSAKVEQLNESETVDVVIIIGSLSAQ